MQLLPALPHHPDAGRDLFVSALLACAQGSACLGRSELQELTGYWQTRYIVRVLDEQGIPYLISGRRGDFPRVLRSSYILWSFGYAQADSLSLDAQQPRLDFMARGR